MQVVLHHAADKYLNRLNAADRDRVDAALDKLEKEPPEGDITPVIGQPGHFKG
jgi:mRNA-degrading endonuclease RelE of RelBE toxin-antitoxin system